MKKGMFISAAITVTLCTVAVTNTARAEQMDAQTADLLRFIEGGSEQASYDATPASASMLEFAGGELQATGHKGKGCGASCCPPTWVGGIDLTIFRPHIHGTHYQRSIGQVDVNQVTSQQHSLDNVAFAPRVTLGKQGECWGVLARFWYMSVSNMHYDPYQGPDWETSTAGNSIKAYTIDLELNRRINYHCWQMNLGVGIRYASLEIDTMATYDRSLPDLDHYSSAFTKSRIDGPGVTLGLDGRRLIWPCHNLSMFWGLRGSVIWGDSDQHGSARASVINYAGANDDADSRIASSYLSSDEALFIGEVQLGLLWEHRLACLPANVFFKIAAEYQFWDSTAGIAPMWDGAFASNAGGDFGNGQYDASSPSASLFGLNLGFGLTWGGCCDSYYKGK